MSRISPDLFQQLIQFLLPFMTSPDEQEAYLIQAYYLREPRLYDTIQRNDRSMNEARL